MSKIVFTFESNAPYSLDEAEELRDSLFETAVKFDEDAIESSRHIVLVDETEEKDEKARRDAEIREAAIGLVEKGAVTVKVTVQDVDGEELFEGTLSTDD